MSVDPLQNMVDAFRSEHDGKRLDHERIRARILAGEPSPRFHRRRGATPWLLAAAVALSGAVALASARDEVQTLLARALGGEQPIASGTAERPAMAARSSAPPPPADIPPPRRAAAGASSATEAERVAVPPRPQIKTRSQPATPVRAAAPPDAVLLPEPGVAVSRDEDLALYRQAHRLHFSGGEPLPALAAWDAYLASHPAGIFAAEARFNRAMCLLRLRRTAEAKAALEPLAQGALGAYRREQANYLMLAIDRGEPVSLR